MAHHMQPLRYVLLRLLLLLVKNLNMSEHEGRYVVRGLRCFSFNFSEQVVPVVVLEWHDHFININHSNVIVSKHNQPLRARYRPVQPVNISIEAIIEGDLFEGPFQSGPLQN